MRRLRATLRELNWTAIIAALFLATGFVIWLVFGWFEAAVVNILIGIGVSILAVARRA